MATMSNFFVDLFSPKTYERFLASDRSVAGFQANRRRAADRLQPKDILVCYLTQVSRWVGLLEIEGGPFQSDELRFVEHPLGPFTLRFRVSPLILLEPQRGVPAGESAIWSQLSFTRSVPKGSSAWTGPVRASLNRLREEDGRLLQRVLKEQAGAPKEYPLDENEHQLLIPLKARRPEGNVSVTVPPAERDVADRELMAASLQVEPRESIKVQALLTRIGATMGFQVWVPSSDRSRVLASWPEAQKSLVSRLPLNYDETTLRTIENIDVLWLNKRSIVRAFEVEHTTSIHSGLLRMADLLALQPNMDIKLHIVAPEARREKVLQEIRRPVFSLLERQPLAACCTYVSYEAVRELAAEQHLARLSHLIVED
jgi:hypothetical protein